MIFSSDTSKAVNVIKDLAIVQAIELKGFKHPVRTGGFVCCRGAKNLIVYEWVESIK